MKITLGAIAPKPPQTAKHTILVIKWDCKFLASMCLYFMREQLLILVNTWTMSVRVIKCVLGSAQNRRDIS